MQDNHINMLWSDEDGGYTADILDLNACSAFGVTPREALDALETARSLGRRGTRRGQADPTASVPSHRLRHGEVAPSCHAVSAPSRREKDVRHGHISTLHIRWARRSG